MINQPHRPAAEIINGVAANLVGGFNPLENYYSQLVHTLAASLDGTLQPIHLHLLCIGDESKVKHGETSWADETKIKTTLESDPPVVEPIT